MWASSIRSRLLSRRQSRSSGRFTFIRTPGTERALSDPIFRAEVEERIAALHRIGESDEVAGAVVFLCSPAASLISGETLVIDGGWTAR
jgi:NAD(P)-dependent dehydrogenase (short-subunit alcohol dehydrogenase family)